MSPSSPASTTGMSSTRPKSATSLGASARMKPSTNPSSPRLSEPSRIEMPAANATGKRLRCTSGTSRFSPSPVRSMPSPRPGGSVPPRLGKTLRPTIRICASASPTRTVTTSPTLRSMAESVLVPNVISSTWLGWRPASRGGRTDPFIVSNPTPWVRTPSTSTSAKATEENPPTVGLASRIGITWPVRSP